MNVREWLAPDGFLSFYHQGFPDPDSEHYHGAPFPDSCHNTGLWLMGEYIDGTISKDEMGEILDKGMRSRWDEDSGLFVRYPGSEEALNRDQVMFLVPPLIEVGLTDIAKHLRLWHMDFNLTLPHWRDHFEQVDSWWGRVFEIGDALADRINPRPTSIVKNIGRLCWAQFKGGDKNECAWNHLKKIEDPYRVMEIYGGRRPDTPLEEYDNLPPTPSVWTPPPIYLPWKRVVPKYAMAV